MKITNNVKFYRKQITNLTQLKLAKKLNIDDTHLQKIEYGKVVPNVYLSQRLAKELNATVEELFPLPSEEKISTQQ